MKSKKIIFLLVLCLTLVMGQTLVFADSSTREIDELNSIANNYNGTIRLLSESEAKNRTFIKVEDADEAKMVIENIIKMMDEEVTVDTSRKNINKKDLYFLDSSLSTRSTEYGNDTHTISKWGIWNWQVTGTTGQVFGWRNITFSYKYKKITSPITGRTYYRFASIDSKDVTSSISGFTPGISWAHDKGSGNIADNGETAKLKVEGTLQIGLVIAGNNYGVNIPDTWKMELSIDDVDIYE